MYEIFDCRHWVSLTAWFAIHMSTHMRTSTFRFGVSTSGDTHGVGPSTFSMMSKLASSSLTRRGCCATGFTVWSMCSLTSTFFSWPMPLKSVGNFSANAFSQEFRESSTWKDTCCLRWLQPISLSKRVQLCSWSIYKQTFGRRTILHWLTLLKVSSSRMSVDAPVSTIICTSTSSVTVDLSWPVVYRYSSSLLLVSGMTVTWFSLVSWIYTRSFLWSDLVYRTSDRSGLSPGMV